MHQSHFTFVARYNNNKKKSNLSKKKKSNANLNQCNSITHNTKTIKIWNEIRNKLNCRNRFFFFVRFYKNHFQFDAFYQKFDLRIIFTSWIIRFAHFPFSFFQFAKFSLWKILLLLLCLDSSLGKLTTHFYFVLEFLSFFFVFLLWSNFLATIFTVIFPAYKIAHSLQS